MSMRAYAPLVAGVALMAEMPERARALLQALVEIEDQAIEAARMGGCKCSEPVPGTDRHYPYASFNSDKSMGKPPSEVVWEVIHQPGCPMDGQEGVGYASHR
jgi:hypothetical protein